MRNNFFLIAVAVIFGSAVHAQSLTPDDILAQVEARLAAQNPYAALLNDPDPSRSLAAMEVMLESGDADLIRLASEFGLLSPNPQVTRAAVDGVLATGPTLAVRLDGADLADTAYKKSVEDYLAGTVDAGGTGYVQIPVGAWDAVKSCYLWRDQQVCVVTIGPEGYLVGHANPDRMRGMMALDAEGRLVGAMRIYRVDEPVPAIIQLLN